MDGLTLVAKCNSCGNINKIYIGFCKDINIMKYASSVKCEYCNEYTLWQHLDDIEIKNCGYMVEWRTIDGVSHRKDGNIFDEVIKIHLGKFYYANVTV